MGLSVDRRHRTDPVSPRVESMVRDYVEMDFRKGADKFCEDTTIYIQKVVVASDNEMMSTFPEGRRASAGGA